MPALRFRRNDDSPSLEAWLASDDPEMLALADETLALMGSELAFQYLLHLFKKREENRRKILYISFAIVVMLIIVTIVAAMTAGDDLFRRELFLGVFLFMPLLSYCFLSLVAQTPRQQRSILERFRKYSDVRALPAILDFLNCWNEVDYKYVAAALVDILPQLTLEDAALLTTANLSHLYQLPATLRLKSVDPLLRSQVLSTCFTMHERFARPKPLIGMSVPQVDCVHRLRQYSQESLPYFEEAISQQKQLVRR